MNSPNKSNGEIVLIGTGGGYGESLVIHLGNNNWIVIDSCQDPTTKECLPLNYLKNIGVNVQNDIKLIICTHWHDDHIRGISKVLEECINAKFCIAKQNDLRKFLRFVKLDHKKVSVEASNSSTIEFNKCMEILESRNKVFSIASSDKVLLSVDLVNNKKSEVISLSPSDFTVVEYDKYISSKLFNEFGSAATKVPASPPNSKSVVILLKLGEHRAILGADLEVTSDDREGWVCILNDSQVIEKNKKSTLIKIPHHGSQTGYHQRIWSELVGNEPIATLTPWNKNGKLPEVEMLYKYYTHTKNLYMTSLVFSEKAKKRDKRIEKMISKLKCKIREVKFKQGIIRSQIDLVDPEAKWIVETIEEAEHIQDDYFS